ncbi:hypothetical protein [Bradyrhizobium mercantei]|uniref:hypothetical protein n=1 Tax=Bradyrhizobium mercantei TaxID=1904807 RepID=UPI00097624A3|nr:hypothetical protein [Bradyrhizobium mercantei]
MTMSATTPHKLTPTDVPIPIPPGDVVPGGIIYQKSATGSVITAQIQILQSATVNITGVSTAIAGGAGNASLTLSVNGTQLDEVISPPNFRGWTGSVQTVMNFDANAVYEIEVLQQNHDANAQSTTLVVTVVMTNA